MQAISITDYGNLYGAFQFVKEARSNNITPIVGCAFYLTEDHLMNAIEDMSSRDMKELADIMRRALVKSKAINPKKFDQEMITEWAGLSTVAMGLATRRFNHS